MIIKFLNKFFTKTVINCIKKIINIYKTYKNHIYDYVLKKCQEGTIHIERK